MSNLKRSSKLPLETDSIPEETEEKSAILCTKAVVDDPSETIIPDQSYQEPDRIDLLESGIKTCRDRLDGFGQELKVLFVEINIISKFIQDQFGKNCRGKLAFR